MAFFYDENTIRYHLVSTYRGKPLNWLFLPGGPGVDSRYFLTLTDLFKGMGNTWLIDFPGNGDHETTRKDFDQWFSIFLSMIKKFDNPVLVGHSFGAMLPLLFPELEDLLTGFVILNSAPSLWLEEASEFAQLHHLPDLSQEMKAFAENPSQKTFKAALSACMPYYFPVKSLERGRKIVEALPFNFEAAVWWQQKAYALPYQAQWIPQNVKTLIIGGEFDGIVPFSLFEKEARFNRPNIKKICIQNAGHFPWLEKPQEVTNLFKKFEDSL